MAEKIERRSYLKTAAGIAVAAVAAGIAGYGINEYLRPKAPAAKTKLRIWLTERYCEPQNNWISGKCLDWATENNVDIEVSWLTWGEMAPKLVTAIEAGTLPDVFYGPASNTLGITSEKEPRYTLHMDDALNELGMDNLYTKFVEPMKIEGHYHAVPFGAMINVVHMIKSYFEAGKSAGGITNFSDSGGPLPETWDDYVELAEAMKKWKPEHHAFGLTLGDGATDGSETWCMTWFPYGGKLMTEASVEGCAFRSQETYDNMYRIKEWWDKGYISHDAVTSSGYWNNEQYTTKASVMICEGPTPWYAATREMPELMADTLMLPPPSGPAGLIGLGGAYAWMAYNTTEHPDLCKDLILYMLSDKDAYKEYVISGAAAHLPILKDVGEELRAEYMPEIVGAMFEAQERCELAMQSWTYNFPSSAQNELYADFTYAMMMSHVVVDGWSVEKAVDEAADHIDEVFQRHYG